MYVCTDNYIHIHIYLCVYAHMCIIFIMPTQIVQILNVLSLPHLTYRIIQNLLGTLLSVPKASL